jgi:hypothetical protein
VGTLWENSNPSPKKVVREQKGGKKKRKRQIQEKKTRERIDSDE